MNPSTKEVRGDRGVTAAEVARRLARQFESSGYDGRDPLVTVHVARDLLFAIAEILDAHEALTLTFERKMAALCRYVKGRVPGVVQASVLDQGQYSACLFVEKAREESRFQFASLVSSDELNSGASLVECFEKIVQRIMPALAD